jgi:serine/threonine-protein kinase
MPRVGDLVAGKYRIENVIGQGGMGTVFAGTHALTGKRVALKWMAPELAADQGAVQRFMREAQAAGRIDHPNVVDVYDVGEHEGATFLVMEFLQGETLTAAFARGGLEARQVIQLLLPAMRGVAAAHKTGVIHRDLKPDNIFLCRGSDGSYREPKVLDFGISKLSSSDSQLNPRLTRTGAVMGTPYYMSPEQIRGSSEVDQRTDVYAFGVILYEALTGRVPFDADAYSALILEIATGTPKRPRIINRELPQGLEDVVLKAMARESDQRYPDVEALARALEPYAHGATFSLDRQDPTGGRRSFGTSTTPFTSEQPSSRVPVNRSSLGIVAALVLLGLGVAFFALRPTPEAAKDNIVKPARSAAAKPPSVPAPTVAVPEKLVPASAGAKHMQPAPDAGEPPEPLHAQPQVPATTAETLELGGQTRPTNPSVGSSRQSPSDEAARRHAARHRPEIEPPPGPTPATHRAPGGRTGTLRSDEF